MPKQKTRRVTPPMIGLPLLSTLSRLRWPGIDTYDRYRREELRVQLWETFNRAQTDSLPAGQQLDAATDILLLSALEAEKDAATGLYDQDLETLAAKGWQQHRVESAAVAKVIAMTKGEDVSTALLRVIEDVPAIHRKRVGRPYESDGPVTPTVKKHSDIDARIAAIIENNRGKATFTNVINDALVLWFILNTH